MDNEGTSIGVRRRIELLRGITSLSAVERDGWARNVAWWDVEGEFDYTENRVVGQVLLWGALGETAWAKEFPVRTSLLDGLDAFVTGDLLPQDVVEQLTAAVPPDQRHHSESDYWETFEVKLEEYRDHPDRPRMPPAVGFGPERPPGLSIRPARCVELVRGLTHVDPRQRELWSAAIATASDQGELDDREATTLATVLGWVLQVETMPAVRTGLLCSLATLARRSLVPADTLDAVLSAAPPRDRIGARAWADLKKVRGATG